MWLNGTVLQTAVSTFQQSVPTGAAHSSGSYRVPPAYEATPPFPKDM